MDGNPDMVLVSRERLDELERKEKAYDSRQAAEKVWADLRLPKNFATQDEAVRHFARYGKAITSVGVSSGRVQVGETANLIVDRCSYASPHEAHLWESGRISLWPDSWCQGRQG